MGRLRALMRMTAVRLSAVYLALFALFAVVLVVYVTATASSILQGQSEEAIREELGQLDRTYQRAGIVGLVRSIDQRSRRPGASLYLMTDATGRILAGNVESLEVGVLDRAGFTDGLFAYRRFGDGAESGPHLALAEVVQLPNGMRILVGRDQTDQERFRLIVRNALILALGLMGAGALLAWFFVGRTALQRIDRMSASSDRILSGDLTERLPVTGAGDEFDRMSDNLNRLLGRIALLQAGLRQVSDNIAHDLKTPLTRLRNRAEAALADRSCDADPRAALEGAVAEADGMIRTFDALLMISRVESGFHPIEKAEIDLSAVLREIAELYEPLAEDAGASLQVEVPDAAAALVSRELVAQALSNLVDNALKYGRPSEGEARIVVRLERKGQDWRLSVSDNGPGVPAEKRGRVLERFYRLDESRTKPGSGLGLSLVQAIARVHGGELVLEDAGPGLRVALDIPAESPDPQAH